MADPYASTPDGLSTPARRAAAIVPSDSTDLPNVTKAIYVGTAGDVVLRAVFTDTVSVTFKNVQPGMILPVCAKRVMATGTTATNLVALS